MGNVFGKPNPHLRRLKVLGLLALGWSFLKRWQHVPQFMTPMLRYLERFKPWKVAIATWMFMYFYNNFSLIAGFNPPEANVPYNDSFFRAVYILTALNAGFITTLHIKNAFLRHCLTIFLVLYYLVFSEAADARLHRYRQSTDVHQIRASFEGVAHHPFLQLIASLTRPRIGVFRRLLLLPRNTLIPVGTAIPTPAKFARPASQKRVDDEWIDSYVYYGGSADQMKKTNKIILHCHGGGWVAMNPMCHEEYLVKFATKLDAVIVCVNYRKAPEHPYPAGLDDCYQVLRQLRLDNGACLGLEPHAQPRTIALMGDSAGGNLAAAMTLKAIVQGVPPPDGVMLIYPCLQLDMSFWHPVECSASTIHELQGGGASPKGSQNMPAAFTFSPSSLPSSSSSSALSALDSQVPLISSHLRFINDRILGPNRMITMIECYLAKGGDPTNDMYLCPLLAPAHILAKFPPLYVHVGDVDPLVDDSVLFAQKVLQAKRKASVDWSDVPESKSADSSASAPAPAPAVKLHLFPGISHAYMHMSLILPEAHKAIQMSIDWLQEMLSNPLPSSTNSSHSSSGLHGMLVSVGSTTSVPDNMVASVDEHTTVTVSSVDSRLTVEESA